MNSWLAQVYGTGGNAGGDDLEKVAQTMLLEKMAQAEGVDISGLAPEQLDALAAEVLEGEGGGEPAAVAAGGGAPVKAAGEPASETGEGEPEENEELMKEAQAKFEEADFLGRVMAHSYTQELDKIAASKAAAPSKTKTAGVGAALGRLREGAGAAASAAKSHGGKALDFAAKHKKEIGIGAGAAAAGGAAGYAAGRSKEASVFVEKLAQIKAAEILTENGIDPATGQPLVAPAGAGAAAGGAPAAAAQPQSPEAQVQQAVEGRAVEILKEAGYTFA